MQPSSGFFADAGKQHDRHNGDDENNACGEHDGRPDDVKRISEKISAEKFYADAG